MDGRDRITGKLNDALDDVRTDVLKVEIWAGALAVFSAPGPVYDLDAQRRQLPHSINA